MRILSSYCWLVHQHRDQVKIFSEGNFPLNKFALPNVLQQHVAEALVEGSTVRQKACKLQNISHQPTQADMELLLHRH